jgi:hypothetical protein
MAVVDNVFLNVREVHAHSQIVLRESIRNKCEEKSKLANDIKKLGDFLILIGGIIGLVQGFLALIGSPFVLLPDLGTYGLPGWIVGILAIVFSLIVLVNSGTLKIQQLEFNNKWLVIFIMAILMYVFGARLGGILVIIGAILLFLA